MESFPTEIHQGLQHMSESVFVGLCEIVGTSQQVALRRDTVDIKEMVENRLITNDNLIRMMSGSRREGFRLKGSDIDTMYWFNDHRVIMDMSQSEYYNTANTILIFADSSESPPGFTLLQKLTPSTRLIEMTKVKLARSHTMFYLPVDSESYSEAVGGQSWFKRMRQDFALDIMLCNKIFFISELLPEQKSALRSRNHILQIPVFVMLHFLEFLCYRHIDTTLSLAALDELQVLVHHGRRPLVHKMQREISWEILGICQQMTGNLEAALYSYQQSQITQHPFFNIQTARQRRIQDIVQSTQHQYTEDLPLD
ncbi:uncharacterized protein [Magallana gigas]|uniref:uncharacterized protein isoform X2 n=1 Tax=Magallana gigas TaxID=29159 RepID=UPI00148A75B4|nr:uncharacterized protein LOC117689174 isoform X2 [Crassostrea gigas]